MAGSATRGNALDHVVVVLFENRSLDNVLGRLYGPGDGKAFEGVIGKDLSNPIPGWAEHGADRKAVPYGVTTDMDSPNPDSGEEWYHTVGGCGSGHGWVRHRLHQHVHRRSWAATDL
jgi:phospholipase C